MAQLVMSSLGSRVNINEFILGELRWRVGRAVCNREGGWGEVKGSYSYCQKDSL